jgi:hypothetical protein
MIAAVVDGCKFKLFAATKSTYGNIQVGKHQPIAHTLVLIHV